MPNVDDTYNFKYSQITCFKMLFDLYRREKACQKYRILSNQLLKTVKVFLQKYGCESPV